jgi:hypothetical protein
MVNSEVDRFCGWARTKSIGCYFARAMFQAPADYGITIHYQGDLDGRKLALRVSELIRNEVLMEASEAVVVVINERLPVEEFATLLRSLSNKPGWYLRETEIRHGERDYAVVGVDVYVGEDQGSETLSEIVGFAPYEYLPVTRRAPTPAIMLRTKSALSEEPLPERAERRANLAAIKVDVHPNAFTAMWQKSKELRAQLDGADNPMARARVALALPADVWAATARRASPLEKNA